MTDSVRETMRKARLASPGELLWVAVSGGVDSMVLLHVLRALGHPCHVLHVDHGLRGAESDGDRRFVEEHCKAHGIPCRSVRMDVKGNAAAGASVQMIARELRYAAFKQAVEEGPVQLALAHHRDDALETFFIHLLRGMGVRGWETIPLRTGAYIRPLLEVDRAAIEAYAAQHAVPFRTDSSNTDPKYLRNRVRHEVLPLLEEMRPGARRVLARNVELFRELEVAAERNIGAALEWVHPEPDGTLRIPFNRIMESGTPLLVLHHLLADQGAHPDVIVDVLRAMEEGATGKTFPLGGTTALIDRAHLVVHPSANEHGPWNIASMQSLPTDAPIRMELCTAAAKEPATGKNVVWLDANALIFPLELRTWRAGDRMRPVGLGGRKLISDILIDAKVSRDVKDRTLVLVSGGNIAWLCGHRVGEGFQAKAEEGPVLRCKLVKR